ncbi:MAG TPA: carbohydrate porin [Kofleriaceae bacterium]
MTRALALSITLALSSSPAVADEFANSPTRSGYEPTGRLLDFEARRHWDVDNGVDPMLTYSLETFVAPQLDDRAVFAGLLMLEVDVALDKLIGPGWGAAYASGFAIHGHGLTDEVMDVHGISGNTAPEDVRLFEAWIEQPIGAFTLRGGLLSADQEFVLADHSTTLLSATFGMTSQFSANIIGPVYPVATPGASGRLELGSFTARLAIYDGTQANSHGIPNALGSSMLALGELAFGPLKLGAWHHDERGNGVYAIADAQLERFFGAFARVGYSPDSPVVHYIDAGVRITPGTWRPDDFISAGIAFATTDAGAQILVETAYECQLRWLTIQPDLQLLMMRDRTIGIIATRATVVF